jgi:IS5 family transposase
VVQAPNDKQQIAPMLEKVDALPEQLGRPETLLADNGYFSEANVMACTAANIEPLIATGRRRRRISQLSTANGRASRPNGRIARCLTLPAAATTGAAAAP